MCLSAEAEMDMICETIRNLNSRERLKFKDIAILVRTHSMAVGVTKHLEKQGITYRYVNRGMFTSLTELRPIFKHRVSFAKEKL